MTARQKVQPVSVIDDAIRQGLSFRATQRKLRHLGHQQRTANLLHLWQERMRTRA